MPIGVYPRKPIDPLVRFWRYVDPCRTDGCAIWTGHINHGGYGYFYAGNGARNQAAHRWIYEQAIGSIPPGLQIDHVKSRGCTHRSCVWPQHLEVVTQAVNLLRGDSPPAQNAVKTSCPQGHEYNLENTYVDKRGRRSCRICHAMTERKRQAALKLTSLGAA